MRLIGFVRVLVLVAVWVVLAAVVSPASAGTVDQQQTDATACASFVVSSQMVAQTFTAGVTGGLDQIDVFLNRNAATSANLTVQIQTVTGGVPSGTVLATETVPAASVPVSPGGWVSVPIDPVVAVVAGTQYAIVLSSTGQYIWLGSTALNPYPGGHSAGGSPPTLPWLAAPASCDQAFATYVVATPMAIRFRSLSATLSAGGVLLRWATASEIDTLGFHVYRQVNPKRTRVNRTLIVGKGRGLYSFLDRKAPNGKGVRYWIQVVNLDGSRQWYGPVRIRSSA